jgi:hypothetical protein
MRTHIVIESPSIMIQILDSHFESSLEENNVSWIALDILCACMGLKDPWKPLWLSPGISLYLCYLIASLSLWSHFSFYPFPSIASTTHLL